MSKEQLYHYNDTIDQLQQENEQLKKEVAELKEELAEKQKHIIGQNTLLNKSKETNNQLKQQLTEKDKEIEELKFIQRNTTGLIEKVSKKGENQVRHEICEEIMNKIDEKFNCCGYIEDIKFEDFKKIILDQIEGEK